MQPPRSYPDKPPRYYLVSIRYVNGISVHRDHIDRYYGLFPDLPSPLHTYAREIQHKAGEFLYCSPVPKPVPEQSFPSHPLCAKGSQEYVPACPVYVRRFVKQSAARQWLRMDYKPSYKFHKPIPDKSPVCRYHLNPYVHAVMPVDDNAHQRN